MKFDFKNGCKNEFKDTNDKSCSRFKNKVPLKIDFKADWTHECNPTVWELGKLSTIFSPERLKQWLTRTNNETEDTALTIYGKTILI